MSLQIPCQSAILEPQSPSARYVVFGLETARDVRAAIDRLRTATAGWHAVIGLGAPVIDALGARIEGMRPFPAMTGPGVAMPSTQGAIWAYLPGANRGETLDRAFAIRDALGETFRVEEDVDAFKYGTGRDLTGFEDGTENPKAEKAIAAAIVSGQGAGLDGGSFVAVQRYKHALRRFHALPVREQEEAVGRELVSNDELSDGPEHAHVKRTAQESFDPPAFMLRRSMPWGNVTEHGLYFVAFVEGLDRFERMLARMAGKEDGIVDALLWYSRALSGGYYWCPPVAEGKLDLSRIGL